MKQQIILIAGCSHTAGAEIDGNQDSEYNRSNSFGNILGRKLNKQPINIASSGSTNATISRSILEWFDTQYDQSTMDVFVLVAWTESSRLELPVENREFYYFQNNPNIDWISKTEQNYFRINQGWPGGDDWERSILPDYQKFIAENLIFLELLSINLVLQLQYFFKSKNIDYIMCNTMHMFEENVHTKFYINLIDNKKYMNFKSNKNAFYWRYKNMGFSNPKAKYWHHNEIPHRLYAEDLFNFIKNNSKQN